MTITTAFNALESVTIGGGMGLVHRGWAINAWLDNGTVGPLCGGDISVIVGALVAVLWWIGKTKFNQRGGRGGEDGY